jgi:flavorubredoxin
MKAVVVYESHWGNTAAVAQAIADGLGPQARALPTDEATAAAVADADLIVAGSPVMAFNLPTEKNLETMATDPSSPPPDVSHPSMRSWLEGLPRGNGRGAAFETRMWWSPGGATGAIERGLKAAGYRRLASGRKFVVTGGHGPLRDGELEAARAWGAELAEALGA